MLNLNFLPFKNLTTERLVLRALKLTDAEAIWQLRSDDSVNQHLDRPKTLTLSEAENFILKIIAGQSLYWAICLKDNDVLIGTICLWNINIEDRIAEIGYELMPDFQGKGIMQEAISAVIKYGFEEIDLKVITALPHPSNNKSVKILERNKFRLDTHFNYCDKEDRGNLVCYYLQKEQ